MAEIAVDFLAGTELSSRCIELFGLGRGGYSHCANVLKDGRYLDARLDRIAGVPSGVHIREAKTERWVRKRRATLTVTEEEYATWESNLRAKITDGYGIDDIISFLDPYEQHLSGHYICSGLTINAVQHVSRVHWTSSSLIAEGLRHAGFIPYPFVWPAHQITPNMCLAILQTAGFTMGDEVRA